MTDTQFYIFIAAALILLIGFVAGMLTINKRLRENKNIGVTVIAPIVLSFLIALVLFVIGYSQL